MADPRHRHPLPRGPEPPSPSTVAAPRGRAARARRCSTSASPTRPRVRPRLPGTERGLEGRRGDLRRGIARRGAGPRSRALRDPPRTAGRGPSRRRPRVGPPRRARGCPSPGAGSPCMRQGAKRPAGEDHPEGRGGDIADGRRPRRHPGRIGRLPRHPGALQRAAAGRKTGQQGLLGDRVARAGPARGRGGAPGEGHALPPRAAGPRRRPRHRGKGTDRAGPRRGPGVACL